MQQTLSAYNYEKNLPSDHWSRRVLLAKLLLAHGASAKYVNLNACDNCDEDNALVPLLVANGADPNRSSQINSAALDLWIKRDKFDAAKRLIALGADPNGSGWNNHSMLYMIADDCDLKHMRKIMPAPRFETESQRCIASSITRSSFAIRQGADPNGKATVVSNCETPYARALEVENHALAFALLELGADPDYAKRCRSRAR